MTQPRLRVEFVPYSSRLVRMSRSPARRCVRYRAELPIIVKVLGQEGFLRIHGRCFEIAESGLGAVISSELTPGEVITLEFFLPGEDDPFVIRAIVRHRMGFLHGFEFVGCLPEQREQLRTLCRNLKPS